MKVPSFKTEKIRKDIFELVELAPTRGMYGIILRSIDEAMDELAAVREEIPAKNANAKKMLKAWDEAFEHFGEREAYYYKAFLESEDRSVVDAPLFEGEYDDFEFEPDPSWPDIETPWRLANELSTTSIAAGADQEFLDDLERRFKNIIADFWHRANVMIVEQKTIYEQQAAGETQGAEGDGKVFGFWPVVAIGAVALVGAFGAAAGYTAAQSDAPEEYVEKSPVDKHLKTAKHVGIGVLIGVGLAVVLMLRVRK